MLQKYLINTLYEYYKSNVLKGTDLKNVIEIKPTQLIFKLIQMPRNK